MEGMEKEIALKDRKLKNAGKIKKAKGVQTDEICEKIYEDFQRTPPRVGNFLAESVERLNVTFEDDASRAPS